MKREIIQTSDGSSTIYLPEWNEHYHSKFGAIQEAKHVFIKNGLSLFEGTEIAILEIGLGTGLNAFITFLEAQKSNQTIHYVGIEAYPISDEEIAALNYVNQLEATEDSLIFEKIHASNWNEQVELSLEFDFTKRKQFFETITDTNQFDLIYFDAFGYRVQPELWSAEIFKAMFNALKEKGVLVTYAARGTIKRNLLEAGFTVEKLQGPPGKREMFRANKV